MERRTRNSPKALIIQNGKAAVKLDDHGDIFYILPGGGQESGELLTDTVIREVAEELLLRVRPKSLEFVIEGPMESRFTR